MIDGIRNTGPATQGLSERSVGAVKKADASGAAITDKQEAKKDLPPQKVDTLASDVQARMKRLNTELRLEVDQKSDRVIVKIVDPGTQKVIRQIPSEELIAISERLEEFVGVFYDSKT